PARYSPLAADAWKSFLIEAPDHGPIGVRIRLGRPVTVQLPAKTSARIRLIGPDGQAASHVEFTVDSISALDDRQWSIPLPERFRNARKGKTDSDGMATIGNLSVGTVVSLRILDDRFTQPASTD